MTPLLKDLPHISLCRHTALIRPFFFFFFFYFFFFVKKKKKATESPVPRNTSVRPGEMLPIEDMNKDLRMMIELI